MQPPGGTAVRQTGQIGSDTASLETGKDVLKVGEAERCHVVLTHVGDQHPDLDGECLRNEGRVGVWLAHL